MPTQVARPGADRDDRRAPAPSPAARPQRARYSTTNTQEEGVDEPDIVKTDGKTIFAIQDNNGRGGGRPDARRLAQTARRSGEAAAARLAADRHFRHRLWRADRRRPHRAADHARQPEHDGHRGQRLRPERDEGLTHDDDRRSLRRRPPERRDGAARHRLATARGRQHDRQPRQRHRLGPDAPLPQPPVDPPLRAPGLQVPDDPPPAPVLRPRDADDPDHRPRSRPVRRRLRRADGRRPGRLRVARQPVRGDAAVDQPQPTGRRPAAGRHDGDRALRRLRPRPHDPGVERPGAGLPAEPVLVVGVRGLPARRDDNPADVLERRVVR